MSTLICQALQLSTYDFDIDRDLSTEQKRILDDFSELNADTQKHWCDDWRDDPGDPHNKQQTESRKNIRVRKLNGNNITVKSFDPEDTNTQLLYSQVAELNAYMKHFHGRRLCRWVSVWTCNTCRSGNCAAGYRATSCYYNGRYYARGCTRCSPGTYNHGCRAQCYACSPGTYENGARTGCNGCPAGRASSISGSGSIGSCGYCAAGRYATGSASSCYYCPAGRYSYRGAGGCTYCPTGRYAPSAGYGSCTGCPAGTFQGLMAQAGCNVCGAGTYSVGGAARCTACAVGRYSSSRASSCSACSPGRYSGGSAASCTLCSPGRYKHTLREAAVLSVPRVNIKEIVGARRVFPAELAKLQDQGPQHVPLVLPVNMNSSVKVAMRALLVSTRVLELRHVQAALRVSIQLAVNHIALRVHLESTSQR